MSKARDSPSEALFPTLGDGDRKEKGGTVQGHGSRLGSGSQGADRNTSTAAHTDSDRD